MSDTILINGEQWVRLSWYEQRGQELADAQADVATLEERECNALAVLAKTRPFIAAERKLIIDCEAIDGDESTLNADARNEVARFDAMLAEIDAALPQAAPTSPST